MIVKIVSEEELIKTYRDKRPKCKDCKHYNPEAKGCKRNPSVKAWEENDYCSYWAGIER